MRMEMKTEIKDDGNGIWMRCGLDNDFTLHYFLTLRKTGEIKESQYLVDRSGSNKTRSYRRILN